MHDLFRVQHQVHLQEHGNEKEARVAEIRAPQGTLPGVSAFQLNFADHDILTPGDAPNVLVAMNPAALMANIGLLPVGATLIVNSDEFTKRNLEKVGYDTNPLEDGSLSKYDVHAIALTSQTVEALKGFDISKKDAERCKNMYALGMLSWLYSRPTDSPRAFLQKKFAKKPEILAANLAAQGFRIVSGGTDNHLMLVDVFSKGVTGKVAEAALGRAAITVNKNAIPFDKNPPMVASGIRVGTPSVTTQGMGVAEMELIGDLIARAVLSPDAKVHAEVAADVHALVAKFPAYPRK